MFNNVFELNLSELDVKYVPSFFWEAPLVLVRSKRERHLLLFLHDESPRLRTEIWWIGEDLLQFIFSQHDFGLNLLCSLRQGHLLHLASGLVVSLLGSEKKTMPCSDPLHWLSWPLWLLHVLLCALAFRACQYSWDTLVYFLSVLVGRGFVGLNWSCRRMALDGRMKRVAWLRGRGVTLCRFGCQNHKRRTETCCTLGPSGQPTFFKNNSGVACLAVDLMGVRLSMKIFPDTSGHVLSGVQVSFFPKDVASFLCREEVQKLRTWKLTT